MRSKYLRIPDGGMVELRKGDELRFECCDCGLVHSIYHEIKDDKLLLRFYRNRHSTGQVRRYRGFIPNNNSPEETGAEHDEA